jgi:cold shock CspA family protein
MTTAPFEPASGVVAAFDEARGVGVIRVDGGSELPFHCTAIADGTRSVTVGQRVRFRVVAALLGRWEASAIEKW